MSNIDPRRTAFWPSPDLGDPAVVPAGKVAMYDLSACPVVDGVRMERMPSADEVLSYFSHPSGVLHDLSHWVLYVQVHRTAYAFTTSELERIHADHRHLLRYLNAGVEGRS